MEPYCKIHVELYSHLSPWCRVGLVYSLQLCILVVGYLILLILPFRSSLEAAYREMAEMKTKLTEAADEANVEALAEEKKARKNAEQRLVDELRTWEVDKQELEARIANVQVCKIG